MGDIHFTGLYKAYGGRQVLQGFSAGLPAGQVTALAGPSGAGKTTLARILIGLEKPDKGRVVGADGLRFACVFQEDRLCPGLTAVENVALVLPRNRQTEIKGALAKVALEEQDFEKPAAQLSGGQKRRVALVRAMEAPWDVLVLDEAFKGLDEDTKNICYSYCKEGIQGRTVLLITHDPAEAAAFEAGVLQLPKLPA